MLTLKEGDEEAKNLGVNKFVGFSCIEGAREANVLNGDICVEGKSYCDDFGGLEIVFSIFLN
jgi:hypothetical protein